MLNYFPRTAMAVLVCMALASPAQAHWCSNIWNAPARIVVKPEKSTVFLSSKPAKLRVYVQNNFPHRLFGLKLRGQAAGYTIMVSPSSYDIQPRQNAGFMLTITKTGAGATVPVSTLNLQVQFRPGQYPYDWLTGSGPQLNQQPTQAALIKASKFAFPTQDASLAASTLSERFPQAKLPNGMTGIQQVISWFGYRFCYSSGGGYRCGGQACPSPCKEGNAWTSTEQFPQNCMRAGVELAGWHARGKLGSQLSKARDGAVNALKGGGSASHKCLAAVVGGYLWQGAGGAALTSALSNGGNTVPAGCRKAGLRALNGSNASSCGSGSFYEKAACAAAEGLRGNDGPVKQILIPNAGDGVQPGGGDYSSHFYAYMLHIVTAHRQAKAGKVSYYPDAGAPTTPGKDSGGAKKDKGAKKDTGGGKQDTGGAALDSAAPGTDAGASGDDDGGCAVAGPAPGASLLMLALALVLARVGRRRRR